VSKKHSLNDLGRADVLAQELEGLIDLGATKQAVKVVRQILKLKTPSASALWHAVRALEMMDGPRHWRSDIEAMYGRLTKRDQRRARSAMLRYYYSIDEPQLALSFCSVRDLHSAPDLMFAMELCLDTNKLAEAKKIARKCEKMKIDNPFDASARCQALASYYARIDKWWLAFRQWNDAPRDQPISRQAVNGCIEVLLAMALAGIEAELRTVTQLRSTVDPHLAVSLPGIQNELLDQTERDLLRFKRGMERLFPPERQRAFGLCDTSRPSILRRLSQ
jgi:hypothetical protein